MERENQIARACCFVLLAIAVGLWIQLIGHNPNVLVSAILCVGLFSFTLEKLDRGAWSGFHRAVIKFRPATWTFIGAMVSAGMVTMRLNGEWDRMFGMPSTCLMIFGGALHIHHWAKSLAVIAWLGDLFDILHLDDAPARDRLIKRYGARTLCLGTVLIVLTSVILVVDYENRSLWTDTALHGLYMIALGAVCRGNHAGGKWFRIYVAAALGIAVGIQLHGDAHIVGEIFSKNGIPSSFIFWHPEIDPACITR